MLHKFFEEGYWFAPKKLGYGSGLPIAWQGWVLLIGYLALTIGLALFAERFGEMGVIVVVAGISLFTIPFLIIVKRRTKGGWKWRS
ncbi:hypothetical protein [Pontixanthobacter sp. CEM42]|uniref:hypothetical protein n=1 Tax=Pontixanthobacter sp. CEM42 TaxID=2792077 RepID=UPI001AE0946C|nr:hypothetical protein [Pontixanthobacter sp. CEM42]